MRLGENLVPFKNVYKKTDSTDSKFLSLLGLNR